MRIPALHVAVLLACSGFLPICARAGSATWNLNPTSGDWNKAANWTPNTVPDNPSDTATFDVSNVTAISQTGAINVAEIIFNPGASAFTIAVGRSLNIGGAGITNNSGVEQNFIVPGFGIQFYNSATAGEDTVFTQRAGGSTKATMFVFHNTSSAGSATFINEGNGGNNPGTAFYDSATAANGMFINKAGSPNSGRTIFYNSSSAANGTFLCESGTAPELAGNVTFIDRSTAGDATITLESSVVSYSTPYVSFSVESSAGNATVIANGGATGGALGGEIDFSGTSTAGNATLILNGGTNGGKGGKIYFSDESDGGTAQVRLSGNAGIHMPNHDPGTVTLGSLAGDGLILLETISLTVGTNNLTTKFDGSIRDSGQSPGASFTKTGSGSLTLTSDSSYDGGTFVQGRGTLFVNNASGSGTGTGTVQVNSGELAGNGIISGPVVIGNGVSGAARFMPGKTGRSPAILTIGNALTFNSDATYLWLLDAVRGIASSVVAKGITIDSAALFSPTELQSGTLSAGTVFTVITNNGAAAILGTFSNLPDGGTLTVGSNAFQASYEGGDGNDLTLTVVP